MRLLKALLMLSCSPALKKLVAMVGGSFTIYKGIVDLCAAKYRDSEGLYVGLKETAYCSLRSQLLMAIHDSGANELCSKVDSLSCISHGNVEHIDGKTSLLVSLACHTHEDRSISGRIVSCPGLCPKPTHCKVRLIEPIRFSYPLALLPLTGFRDSVRLGLW